MICRGKGENKEYCDRVIKEILEHWDETIGKTTNTKGVKEDEADRCG